MCLSQYYVVDLNVLFICAIYCIYCSFVIKLFYFSIIFLFPTYFGGLVMYVEAMWEDWVPLQSLIGSPYRSTHSCEVEY